MSDNNQNLPVELSKALVEVAKPIYDDAVSPSAKRIGNIGDTLFGLIEIMLFPVTKKVYQFDQNRKHVIQALNEKLTNTPKENIITPPNYLAIPTLQKLVYTDNEELQDMFANLLANSMDKQTTDKAHPAFVEIISQLTPDEAKLLKYLSTQGYFPKIDIIAKDLNSTSYAILKQNVSLYGTKAELNYPDKTPIYFNNFERLGLFKILSSTDYIENSYTNSIIYEELISFSKREVEDIIIYLDHTLEFKKGRFELTDFGRMFLEVVTEKII